MNTLVCFLALAGAAAMAPSGPSAPEPSGAAGFFQGSVTSKQEGKLEVTLNMRHMQGKYEGELVTPLGTFPVQSGEFDAGRLRLRFDAGGAAGTIAARLDGQMLRGTFQAGDDGGPVELRRVGEARAPSWNTPTLKLTPQQWHEDLKFFATKLPRRHINAFHHISRQQFEAAVAALDGRIDHLNGDAIFVGLVHIVSLIGDGHTNVEAPPTDGNLPLDVRRFGNDYRVVAVADGDRAALGARVVKVQDVPIARACQQLLALTPEDETPTLRQTWVEGLLTTGLYLHGLGITPARDQVRYTLADDAGKEFTALVHAVSRDDVQKREWTWAFKQQPLYRQRPGEVFWYTYLPDAQVVYCNFRGYGELGRHARGLLELVRQKRPDKLIIDLRQNGGGDYTEGEKHLIEPIRRLASINRKGHLFMLIGPHTFSAAMSNAAQFRSRTSAILVGEPIGEKPNSYQEVRQMRLPNSRLVMRYSTRFYKFVEGGDNEIRPDQPINRSWDAYKAGRDPALEWVLQYKGG